jgi:hypothetical protein
MEAVGIDQHPLLVDLGGLGRKGFHLASIGEAHGRGRRGGGYLSASSPLVNTSGRLFWNYFNAIR